MKTLVLATGNLGKVREFSILLKPLGWEVKPQSDFAVPECPEPHPSFVENALAKARHASQCTGLPSLADDSGLCVAALGGEPGVLSARYAVNECLGSAAIKSDDANNRKLLKKLEGVLQREAYFVCVLVGVRHPQDPEPLIAIGRWHGSIGFEASGANGFGYDPLFVCDALGLSAASMTREQKSAISHRAQAVNKLLPLMQHLWQP